MTRTGMDWHNAPDDTSKPLPATTDPWVASMLEKHYEPEQTSDEFYRHELDIVLSNHPGLAEYILADIMAGDDE